MEDIIEALHADHAKHRALFERLGATTAAVGEIRARLLTELDYSLRLHMRFEEDVLFPALRSGASKATRSSTLEAYAKHEAARATLNELESVAPDSDTWQSWLKVLHDELELHMKEEEEELFSQARRLLSADTRQLMAAELRRWQADANDPSDDLGASEPHHIPLVGLH